MRPRVGAHDPRARARQLLLPSTQVACVAACVSRWRGFQMVRRGAPWWGSACGRSSGGVPVATSSWLRTPRRWVLASATTHKPRHMRVENSSAGTCPRGGVVGRDPPAIVRPYSRCTMENEGEGVGVRVPQLCARTYAAALHRTGGGHSSARRASPYTHTHRCADLSEVSTSGETQTLEARL
jgi:hypothetical protein